MRDCLWKPVIMHVDDQDPCSWKYITYFFAPEKEGEGTVRTPGVIDELPERRLLLLIGSNKSPKPQKTGRERGRTHRTELENEKKAKVATST